MKNDTDTSPIESIITDSLPVTKIKIANLLADPQSRLDSTEMKHSPIDDASIPFRDMTSATTKKESIARLINKLDVSKNIRYKRTVEDTYCNVYSYDYCYFSNVYLPTVWWTDEAIDCMQNGQEVEAIYGQTVETIYSSAIHDWFLEWGSSFGWQRIFSLDEMQDKVNTQGGVGIICAKRKQKGLSGHIVPVVPETDRNKAYRENGVVKYPLQSQAGKLNYNYFAKARKEWWNNVLYSSSVFYYHE